MRGERHINSSASRYWIIVGIFMGISTALLGGVAYGFMSNSIRLNVNIWVTIVPLVLGSGIIVILVGLKRYVRRVTYIMRLNYERMREIEVELGMWRNWRVHILDQWHRKRNELGFNDSDRLSDKDRKKIWDELLKELKIELSEEGFKQLLERKESLIKLCDRWQRGKPFRSYELPSGLESMTRIFCTVILMWVALMILIVIAFLISC